MRLVLIFVIAFDLYASSMVTYITGDSPIILSAPHGGQKVISDIPLRENTNLPLFRTKADKNTDIITKRVFQILKDSYAISAHVVIANFKRSQIDANRKPSHAYEVAEAKKYYDEFHHSIKKALKHVKESYKEGLLVEIHGQSFIPDVLYLGTRNGDGVSKLLKRFPENPLYETNGIHTTLLHEGYQIIPANSQTKEKKYSGGYNIDQYGSHKKDGIDALQIEIGRDFRIKENEQERIAQAIAKAISLHVRFFLPDEKTDSILQKGTK